MKITRTSMLTGVERTREIDCTELQLNEYQTGRRTIQACFPHLSPSDREFADKLKEAVSHGSKAWQ